MPDSNIPWEPGTVSNLDYAKHPPVVVELNRCIPCKNCGCKPEFKFETNKNKTSNWLIVRCPEIKKPDLKKKTFCGGYNVYIEPEKLQNYDYRSARITWNARQNKSEFALEAGEDNYLWYSRAREQVMERHPELEVKSPEFQAKQYQNLYYQVRSWAGKKIGSKNGHIRKLSEVILEKKSKIIALQSELQRLRSRIKYLETMDEHESRP